MFSLKICTCEYKNSSWNIAAKYQQVWFEWNSYIWHIYWNNINRNILLVARTVVMPKLQNFYTKIAFIFFYLQILPLSENLKQYKNSARWLGVILCAANHQTISMLPNTRCFPLSYFCPSHLKFLLYSIN